MDIAWVCATHICIYMRLFGASVVCNHWVGSSIKSFGFDDQLIVIFVLNANNEIHIQTQEYWRNMTSAIAKKNNFNSDVYVSNQQQISYTVCVLPYCYCYYRCFLNSPLPIFIHKFDIQCKTGWCCFFLVVFCSV